MLGIDALRAGGPGEHLFGTSHTLAHFETAYWDSELNDDQSFEDWSEQGRQDAMSRAHQRWQTTLREYQAPPLDQATDEALISYIETRKRSMEDAWY